MTEKFIPTRPEQMKPVESAPQAESCCSPKQQESCCAPSEKQDCCSPAPTVGPGTCGCKS